MPHGIGFSAVVLALAALSGCGPPDRSAERERLIATDRAFSRLSVEKGTAEAFHHYMADSGAALPRSGHPLTRAAYDGLRREPRPAGISTSLSWEPLRAEVASSGDLGYTHGTYRFERTDSTGTSVRTGYYVTVWKKESDGSWRFVMDAGNEVPPPDSAAGRL